ncbi:MAG TPA: penicillin-binding protein 1A, partial [Candidatus Avacidaminococcus intestinavium]|nr:penicillin-binding protein 1A [Candidatus Avacidaminococcus intestinavium]
KIISAIIIIISIGAIFLAGFFLFAKYMPSDFMSEDIIQPAASQFYDSKGQLISTTDSEEDRIPVSISKVPQNLQDAFIAVEDVRFYDHSGIDFRGIARAFITNVFGSDLQGGSSITQQLAKNAFLSQDRTLQRKVKEAFIAIQLEQKYTKQEIFEMYLNQIYFGQGAYGVESAALTYFGTHVQDLSLAQAAMLAGLPKSPNYYSPLTNPKAGAERQHIVLDQMAKYGFITEDQAAVAKQEKLVYATSNNKQNSLKYFLDYCTQQVIDQFGYDAVYKQGLKIYTTVDLQMQKAANASLSHLPNYYTDENKLVQPQVALVAVDPQTGYIKAMIGGRGNDHFNRAVLAERQPGSAFKPFVYLAAIDNGMSPATVIEDKELDFAKTWNPQNYDRQWHGKISMRTAIVNSYNIPAVLVAQQVGPSTIIDYAKKMGISTMVTSGNVNDNNLAMALGGLTRGTTPLEMSAAFAVLANNGTYNKPIAITKVVDRNGKVLLENKAKPEQVVNPKSVYVLVDILKEVINRGTGGGAAIGRPAAGKTGTTNDYKDAWFVGFTPDLSTAVWIGDDNGEPLNGMTGGLEPAYIWRDFMSSALVNIPASDFIKPAGVVIPPEPKIIKEDNEKKDLKTGKIPNAIKKGSKTTKDDDDKDSKAIQTKSNKKNTRKTTNTNDKE